MKIYDNYARLCQYYNTPPLFIQKVISHPTPTPTPPTPLRDTIFILYSRFLHFMFLLFDYIVPFT
jgi:hypothetical protein